jgi:O-antigen/teichoic acid export membrane protein
VVRVTAGTRFLPSVPALMILCVNFVITYVAVICSYFMWAQGRGWTMTGISAMGLVVNPIFNILLIRPLAVRGAGWAGTGAALATVATEAVVTVILLALVGRGTFDRKSLSRLARTAVVMAVVVGLHLQLRPLVDGPPPWLGQPHGVPVLALRVLLDAAAYVVLAVLTRAVNIKETLEFARGAARARQEPKAA